jgi:hypothetical protein
MNGHGEKAEFHVTSRDACWPGNMTGAATLAKSSLRGRRINIPDV